MLGKLIKYDLRALVKTAFPMLVSSGIISVICCALMFFTLSFNELDGFYVAFSLVSSFYIIGLIAIGTLCAISSFFAIYRYYKSVFTDEGYLTMSLPVKTSVIFSGKLISAFIWSCVSNIVMIVLFFISLALPVLLFNPFIMENPYELAFLEMILSMFPIEDILISLTVGLFDYIEITLIIFTSITLGSLKMRKHKILGAILFFVILTFIESAVISFAENILWVALFDNEWLYDLLYFMVNILLSVTISVALFFFNVNALQKKLNLE